MDYTNDRRTLADDIIGLPFGALMQIAEQLVNMNEDP